MRAADRLRTETRDLVELVLLPGIAIFLPWPITFRIFRWLCGYGFLYRQDCSEALAQARSRGWLRGDVGTWLRVRRLTTLIDHADLYLARSRTDRWMARHLSVRGDWPQPGRPAILCTFHWGAGMWALRHAATRGLDVHFLSAPLRREQFKGRSIAYWYYSARMRCVAAATGRAVIEVTRMPRSVLKALRDNEQIVSVADVPSDQVVGSELIDLIGMRARVPRGLLRVACESDVPVTVYLLGVRLLDGMRTLRIHPLGSRRDQESLIREVFTYLESAIEEEPAAWHFWAIAPRFFEPAGIEAAAPSGRAAQATGPVS